MADLRNDNLVSTEWLEANLSQPDLVVVDGSWYLPDAGRDPKAEYAERHIPGAVFFDIDQIAERDSDLPHMLASPIAFSSAMRRLGIGDGQRIIVYDGMGVFSAPRVWWTLKVMGVRDVAVLDGGLPKWISEDRPVNDEPVSRPERHFSARLDHSAVADLDDMMKRINQAGSQIVDARSAGRFSGSEPEPRPGMRSGHLPGSHNVHYAGLLQDGQLRDEAALRSAFEAAGVDITRPITTTCGSGISAAILTLALTTLGHRKLSLYDGSWTERGGREDTPIETAAS
ncbi:MAG: 3-mercaptopyruvate sulfurtransferase [Pseudomonadota bacterium]